jgi:glycosyltransferase involved in cell wall biosynthesis
MRLGLDIACLNRPTALRGIGRYAKGLRKALAQAGAVVVSYDGRTEAVPSGLDALLIPSPIESCPSPAQLDEADCPAYLFLYDLIPDHYPDAFAGHPDYIDSYRFALAIGSLCAGVFAPTEAIRRELIDRKGFSAGRVHVAGAAAHPEVFRPAQGTQEERYGVARLWECGLSCYDYILNVGGEDRRKGWPELIEAFSLLGRDDLLLVFAYRCGAGHRDELIRTAARLGVASRVRVLGEVDDATLVALYRNAAVMAFASHYEGFGLPIIEAQACGCPVLVNGSDPAQAEVSGDGGDQCSSADPKDIALMLDGVLRRKDPRLQRVNALANAARHTWAAVAGRVLAVLAQTPQPLV